MIKLHYSIEIEGNHLSADQVTDFMAEFKQTSLEVIAVRKLHIGEGFKVPCRWQPHYHGGPGKNYLYCSGANVVSKGGKKLGFKVLAKCDNKFLTVVRVD